MKALVLRAIRSDRDGWEQPDLRWEDVPVPSPGYGELLVQVRACGVCGTDVHCIQTRRDGRILYSGPLEPPVVLGHEFAGQVVRVGEGVRSLRAGDLVTCEGVFGCGVCRACCGGHPNQCPELKLLGIGCPGAFSEYIVVHERCSWSLNRLVDVLGDEQRACEIGALVEPVACSYNGIFVTAGGMRPGENVVVYGAGPVGLGAIALTRLGGAATVIAFEPSPKRRELAKTMGADYAFDPGDRNRPIHQVVKEMTSGRGADLHVECAGALSELMQEIEPSFAPGGRLVYLGRTGENISVALDHFVSGANKIIGSRGHAGGECFTRIIRLLEKKRLDIEPMITTRMPMFSAIQAIHKAGLLEDGKVMTHRD